MKRNQSGKKPLAQIDERAVRANEKAGMICGWILVGVVLIAAIIRVIRTGELGWEILAVIGYPCLFGLLTAKLGNLAEPKDLAGNPLPLDDAPEKKKIRIRCYAAQALIEAVTMGVFFAVLPFFEKDGKQLAQELFAGANTAVVAVLSAVIGLMIFFIIGFAFEYFFGERNVRRYRAQFDEE